MSKIISNEHICEYGFNSYKFTWSNCIRNFFEYWPSVILRKIVISVIAKMLIVYTDKIQMKYRHSNVICKKLATPVYDIQRSVLVVLGSMQDSIMYGFIVPLIIPVSALVSLLELVNNAYTNNICICVCVCVCVCVCFFWAVFILK